MPSLTRRLITGEYERLKISGFDGHYVRELCDRFGYTVDCNGSNSWIKQVIRDHERALAEQC
jgi:hypothetical protein